MWRRTYLFLLAVRLWFALSPSYLHPDENFQGPEVIAGKTAAAHPPCLHVNPWARVATPSWRDSVPASWAQTRTNCERFTYLEPC